MKYIIIIIFTAGAGISFFNSCQSAPIEGSPFSEHQNMDHRHIASKASPITITGSQCGAGSGQAVVLMYHRFDDQDLSTSITIKKFTDQMEFFRTNNHQVVSLEKVVSAVSGFTPFGEKWTALTIDDAYKSFLKVKPILEQYNYPYTIFVNTKSVGQAGYMNWEDLKAIQASPLGLLGAHTHSHASLARGLSTKQRKQEILVSVKEIYKNTGTFPQFFSYPYGETSEKLINQVENLKTLIDGKDFYFTAAFSTQSGPVGCSSNMFSLARFAMNNRYGEINKSFRTKMNSLHLPVYDEHPKSKALCPSQNIDNVYFSTPANMNLNTINCFINRGNNIENIKTTSGLVQLKLKNSLGAGAGPGEEARERINCTAYDKNTGRFFWHGQEFTILTNSKECS